MGFLDHQALAIIKGVGKVPGDTNSAEPDPVVVNLLDTPRGITLEPLGWSPNIPTIKTVWAENPITDGRTLLSGALDNITETMRVSITGSTYSAMFMSLVSLYRMRQDAIDFWQTDNQIEPVYLKWWASCGAGPQYALIYNMDIAVEYLDSPTPLINATLTIEREYGWRGLPPGYNPKAWALGSSFSSSNANLRPVGGASGELFYSLVQNSAAYGGNKQTYLTKNFLDIPAASIPGDLPALFQMLFQDGNSPPASQSQIFFISRNTKKVGLLKSGVDSFYQALTWNAADGTLGTDTVAAADTGAPVRQSSGAATRVAITPADNTDRVRVTITSRTVNNHRGMYQVFVRARQPTGAAGDITMYLAYGYGSPFVEVQTTTPVQPTIQAGAGNTTYWPVTNMGIIQYPIDTRANMGVDGLGAVGIADLTLQLWVKRNAGTTGALYVSDIILIPLDEPAFKLSAPGAVSGLDNGVVDNTGYFMHGRTDTFFSASTTATVTFEYDGPDMYLLPGVDNRIYCFSMFSDGTSKVDWQIGLRGNIVPRWTGIRDV